MKRDDAVVELWDSIQKDHAVQELTISQLHLHFYLQLANLRCPSVSCPQSLNIRNNLTPHVALFMSIGGVIFRKGPPGSITSCHLSV